MAERNQERLWGQPNPQPYVKDAFDRYLVHGEAGAVNPSSTGREAEADAFYAGITPPSLGDDARQVIRQALGAMLWTKQYYVFDLDRWLKERNASPISGGASHQSGRAWDRRGVIVRALWRASGRTNATTPAQPVRPLALVIRVEDHAAGGTPEERCKVHYRIA